MEKGAFDGLLLTSGFASPIAKEERQGGTIDQDKEHYCARTEHIIVLEQNFIQLIHLLSNHSLSHVQEFPVYVIISLFYK